MTDYMILLNHTHRLPEGFENTITLVEAKNVNGETYRVEEKAYKAFLALREDLMANDGLQIELLSVYRDIPQQERTWARTLESKGEEYTRKYVAIPGCSEHHTGFALDVGFALNGKASHRNADLFSYEEMYQVVHKKMPKYGFILRYPADKISITKINYEPWHFRYIDDPVIAQEITDKGICFEEYLKKPDYMILLNHTHSLPEGFEDTIELITVKNCEDDEFQIEKKAYEAFLRLRQDMLESEGLQIELNSVYRSVERQQITWDRTLELRGLEYTQKYVAIPGCSEHHTGFGVDIGAVVDGKLLHGIPNHLAHDHLYKLVHKKLAKYGFILRYPEDKQHITKIGYEPWHIRYIDDPVIAQEITDKGICFEEYWENK